MRKQIFFSFATIIIFFLSAEVLSRLLSQSGSYDFIERSIIEQGLKQKKAKDEFRILLYGESTMHGSHLYKKSTIKKWIELYLENLLDKQLADRVTVINFGRVGYDSRFIAQSFIDTVGYRPDLAVFYSVHNDFVFLENRQGHLESATLLQKTDNFFKNGIKKSAFITILRRMNIKRKIEQAKLEETQHYLRAEKIWYDETQRKTRQPQSHLLYPGSEESQIIEAKWQANIRKIIDTAQKHRIPVVFLNGIARLKDFPPYESIHVAGLSEDGLEHWEEVFGQAEEKFTQQEYEMALTLYQQALGIDPQYALVYFRMAQCYERLGLHQKANDFYLVANDYDHFLTRAPSFVNKFYDQLAQSGLKGVFVLDIKSLFEQHSPHGIIDQQLIVDHMHPTIEGQALIAKEIVRFLYEQELYLTKGDWRWDQLKETEEFKMALQTDPDFEYENYMYSANFVGSYYDQAQEYLEKALMIKPQSIAAKSQLAWTYWQNGHKEEALQLYKQLYQQVPHLAEKFLARHPEVSSEIISLSLRN